MAIPGADVAYRIPVISTTPVPAADVRPSRLLILRAPEPVQDSWRDFDVTSA